MRGINENTPIPDIFCSGLGAIEQLEGGNFRFYLYVSQEADDHTDAGSKEKVLVAKLIAPASAIPDAILQMITAIGARAMRLVPLVEEMVH